MISPTELGSFIAALTAVGISASFYFKNRRLLSENKDLLSKNEALYSALHVQVEGVVSAAKNLSAVVGKFEEALKNALKQALAESIVVTRTGSSVEIQNGRPK